MRLRHIVVDQMDHSIPPLIGTLGRRFPNEAMAPNVDGPLCQLCHRAITETRCMFADNGQFHVWHFSCSFCLGGLSETNFAIADDNKPYCNNCLKRMYPKDK